jgi:hypothetical protein
MLGGGIEPTTVKISWFQKLWMGLTEHDVSGNPQQLQQSLHATTVKLVQVHRQIDRLQSQRNLERMQLAKAYQSLPQDRRQQLPTTLRNALDRIEAEYF